ncbi:hypothetical protein CYLTODRAFT_447244 [Cylindrobasidium torrendii FP15055 ss-10]|uniref:Uncharacterized protein n=1 Tax=Cylindrobasidium torrendii FP15055 ss-10 TaxID=1314674 RepID=A0A0D7AWJ0_9AGAR|nr:hypothetical protein CYLTODRAFT_447244 [Cylindrobasidium torrendii FP15055 ss-10]
MQWSCLAMLFVDFIFVLALHASTSRKTSSEYSSACKNSLLIITMIFAFMESLPVHSVLELPFGIDVHYEPHVLGDGYVREYTRRLRNALPALCLAFVVLLSGAGMVHSVKEAEFPSPMECFLPPPVPSVHNRTNHGRIQEESARGVVWRDENHFPKPFTLKVALPLPMEKAYDASEAV